mmetsp:Transcript_43302/g.101534  ORF Transcript_43302/g.101534 Transcript_43302/m.101534 type:complete len:284 (-) Transcript_43302:1828-2679(-)
MLHCTATYCTQVAMPSPHPDVSLARVKKFSRSSRSPRSSSSSRSSSRSSSSPSTASRKACSSIIDTGRDTAPISVAFVPSCTGSVSSAALSPWVPSAALTSTSTEEPPTCPSTVASCVRDSAASSVLRLVPIMSRCTTSTESSIEGRVAGDGTPTPSISSPESPSSGSSWSSPSSSRARSASMRVSFFLGDGGGAAAACFFFAGSSSPMPKGSMAKASPVSLGEAAEGAGAPSLVFFGAALASKRRPMVGPDMPSSPSFRWATRRRLAAISSQNRSSRCSMES